MERVVLIGSGNWGSAIAAIIGQNTRRHSHLFVEEVRMWVFEETVGGVSGTEALATEHEMYRGQKLSHVINTAHENVKYLPGITLPTNVVAVPDLKTAVAGATCLIFVVPHQFLPRLLPDIKAALGEAALTSGAVKAISLIKGIDFNDAGLVLISDTIRSGLCGVDTAVLMGANVAKEVAEGQFCEATVGCTCPPNASLWKQLFDTESFRIETTDDAATVELCGALKNVVALGAGFCDGLGYGSNTKSAILRIGLLEMRQFCRQFYSGREVEGGVRVETKDETFLESCGVADLITTSYSGRNRKVAEAFVRTGRSWDELEAEMLGGQKLQGTLTCDEVYQVLSRAKAADDYPLFTIIYRIMKGQLPPTQLVKLYSQMTEAAHASGAHAPLHVTGGAHI